MLGDLHESADVCDELNDAFDMELSESTWRLKLEDLQEGLTTYVPASGINPVTLTPKDKSQRRLVLSRMHVGIMKTGRVMAKTTSLRKDDRKNDLLKLFIVAFHHPGETPAEVTQFDEDHVIQGLKHLFPNGELNAFE
jgi:hypothetical protein